MPHTSSYRASHNLPLRIDGKFCVVHEKAVKFIFHEEAIRSRPAVVCNQTTRLICARGVALRTALRKLDQGKSPSRANTPKVPTARSSGVGSTIRRQTESRSEIKYSNGEAADVKVAAARLRLKGAPGPARVSRAIEGGGSRRGSGLFT